MAGRLTDPQIVELGKQIYDIIDPYIRTDDGWTFCEEAHHVKMYKRAVEKKPGVHMSGNIIRGVGFVEHATVAEFVRLVLEPERRALWDNSSFYDVVATIDEQTDVCHVGVPGWGPISARDFVTVRRSINDKTEDSYTAVQVSIEYPTDGRDHLAAKHVRGNLLPSCWKFIQRPGGCDCVYISGVQLGGWLPQSIVDSGVYNNTHKEFFPKVRKVFLDEYNEKHAKEQEKDKEPA